MKSPLNSIKKQYLDIRKEFVGMPVWLKLGSYGVMLVGPNTDPTIAAADKATITNITLGIGAAIMFKKADRHRRGRHQRIVDDKVSEIASQRLEKAHK